MTLPRLEDLAARAAAGLATEDELCELAAALESDDDALGLAEALRAEAGEIDLAADIMAAIEPVPDEAWLDGFADGQLEPARRAELAARLSPADHRRLADIGQISTALREGLAREAGPAPDLWAPIARAIGVADPEAVPGWQPALLAEAVRAEAGSVNVVEAVMARVRPAAATEPAPLPFWRRLFQGISLPALGMATAAALVLLFPRPPAPGVGVAFTFDVAPVNHVAIEEISAGPDAMVQVLQFDQDAPTIIFIDEAPGAGEGATL